MKQTIKQVVISKQLEQFSSIKITDQNRILIGETFEAYIKRMAAQRKAA